MAFLARSGCDSYDASGHFRSGGRHAATQSLSRACSRHGIGPAGSSTFAKATADTVVYEGDHRRGRLARSKQGELIGIGADVAGVLGVKDPVGKGLRPSLAFATNRKCWRGASRSIPRSSGWVRGMDRDGGGDEDIELPGVALDALGKARTGQHLIESVADVLQIAVEVVAVALEPILEALEQVAREIG